MTELTKQQIAAKLMEGPRRWDGQGTQISPNYVPGSDPLIEAMREAALNDDFETMFRILPAPDWPRVSMGKFRFRWGADGKPIYVPWTKASMEKFFRGPWLIISDEWDGTCPDDFVNKYSHDYFIESEKHRAAYKPDNPAIVYHMYPASLKCKKKQGSQWVQNRKAVAIAAAVTGAVFLGPAVAAKAKGLFTGGAGAGGAGAATGVATGGAGAAAGSAASAAAKLLPAAKVTGSALFTNAQQLVDAINQGRTLKAIAEGKAPPPPISVSGSNFREWAMIVAKQELENEAKERAAELGQEYIQRKLTAREEAQLRAEIAAMQRELETITPRNLPIETDPNLNPMINQMQQREVVQKDALDKNLQLALLVAIPLLLLRG